MRAEQAEGWPLAHSGRVRMGMKKQITVMSMKATICIWLCQFKTFISFLFLSCHHLSPYILSRFSAFILSAPSYFILATTAYHTTFRSQIKQPTKRGCAICIEFVLRTNILEMSSLVMLI